MTVPVLTPVVWAGRGRFTRVFCRPAQRLPAADEEEIILSGVGGSPPVALEANTEVSLKKILLWTVTQMSCFCGPSAGPACGFWVLGPIVA